MTQETWIEGQCQDVIAYLMQKNGKKAYQLVKDLSTEKQDKIYNLTGQISEESPRRA